jgi:single-strand DNA-binding protein
MAGVNKAILIGHLGADPDVRYLPSGDAVANVSLATSETWKDKQSGERQERTEWHRVTFFGKLVEIVQQYLRKGSKIYIEGKLRTRKYQKDGQDHYATEIVVDMNGTMQMLDGRPDGQSGAQGARQAGPGTSAANGSRDSHRASQSAQAPAGGQDFCDEIPF